MKKTVLILAVSLVVILSTPSAQTRNIGDHSEWVGKSLSAIQTIKLGMTRADLLKLFTEDGGLSIRSPRTYVFRECPYIKVDVEFKPVGAFEEKLKELPADTIVRISRPYLQQIVLD